MNLLEFVKSCKNLLLTNQYLFLLKFLITIFIELKLLLYFFMTIYIFYF